MNVDVKKLPKSQVELTITVPYKDYKEAEKKGLEMISKEMKVDGFRPGNIPEDVVRQKAGPETVMSATLEFLVPKTYTKAVKENDLQVISQPSVDIKKAVEKEGDDFVYTAVAAVMPEVKLGNYKKIKVAKKPAKVDQKNVDETVNMIKDRFAEWNDVDRKVKKGDRAETSFEGFDEAGAAIPNTASKNHPIIVGSGTMIPGFEDALIGMDKDETKEFTVTFPRDYHAEQMQGKKVKFKATVHRIEEKADQKLDEAFVEKVTGQKQSVDEFKKRIEEDLQKEMEQRVNQEHFDNVVKEIVKITDVELPDELIEQELNMMMQEQKQQVQQQGLQWDQYLQHVKKSEEELREQMKKPAKERLVARLGVSEIIKDAGIETTDDEVQAKVEELVGQYPEEQAKKVREYYQKGSDAYRNLQYRLSVDKMIDMLTK